MMNFQLFDDLAASEEASGYPENARALRAVPKLIIDLQTLVELSALPYCHPALANARAALAAMDATNNKGDETMDRQVIGSIDLDTTPPRRGDITLEDGRLWCDGHDITPREEAYSSIEQARKDVAHLYSGAVWGLELID